MHIEIKLTCVLKHISLSMEGRIQYNHPVNSIAVVVKMVDIPWHFFPDIIMNRQGIYIFLIN